MSLAWLVLVALPLAVAVALQPVAEREDAGTTLQSSEIPPIQVNRFFFSAQEPPRRTDITLALQGDISRLKRVEELAKQWAGPISLAVLLRAQDISKVQQFIVRTVAAVRRHVSIHVCTVPERWERYPINFMRNVALANVKSDYVYILDIDESVGSSMRQHLDAVERAVVQGGMDPAHTAFVLTSWQWSTEAKQTVPTTKQELVQLHAKGFVTVKHPEWTFAYLNPSMSFAEWRDLEEAKPVPYSEAYEPYYIARTKLLPRFDERFVGFGGNFVLQTMTMALQSYSFVVLPSLFNFADETPAEANAGHSPNEQDMALMERVWRELDTSYGCAGCLPNQCVSKCPALFNSGFRGKGGGGGNETLSGDQPVRGGEAVAEAHNDEVITETHNDEVVAETHREGANETNPSPPVERVQ